MKRTINKYELKLVRSVCAESAELLPQVRLSQPDTVAAFLRARIGAQDREHFVVIALGTKNDVLGVHTVSIGTLDTSMVHPREVFKALILAGAASFIAAHNHPSGDVTPSEQDRQVTDRLRRAGELLGIPLLDHVIVCDSTRFYSFAREGSI